MVILCCFKVVICFRSENHDSSSRPGRLRSDLRTAQGERSEDVKGRIGGLLSPRQFTQHLYHFVLICWYLFCLENMKFEILHEFTVDFRMVSMMFQWFIDSSKPNFENRIKNLGTLGSQPPHVNQHEKLTYNNLKQHLFCGRFVAKACQNHNIFCLPQHVMYCNLIFKFYSVHTFWPLFSDVLAQSQQASSRQVLPHVCLEERKKRPREDSNLQWTCLSSMCCPRGANSSQRRRLIQLATGSLWRKILRWHIPFEAFPVNRTQPA